MLRGRVFYWCHNTIGQNFETGIQRVTRRLAEALATMGVDVVPIGWDDRTRQVQLLGRSVASRSFEAMVAEVQGTSYLFVPEVTMDLVIVDVDPIQIGRIYGLRTCAIVHDLIPLKLRDDYSDAVVRGFERYYAGLAFADELITTTHYVARDLRHHLEAGGLRTPNIGVVPLPAQFASVERVPARSRLRQLDEPLRLVSVSSWEPRKNLPRLLRALAKARGAARVPITLDLVGRRGTFPAFDAEVLATLTTVDDVSVGGTMSDQALAATIASRDASVYPSWEEGYGLPIGESLWLGTPCLCHDGSSMAEIAPGGGTMMIDMTNEDALAAALLALATEPELLPRLSGEIVSRALSTWVDFGHAVARALWPEA